MTHGLTALRDRILASLSPAEMHACRKRRRPQTPHLQLYLGDEEPDRLHPWLRREVFVHILNAEFEARTRIPERYGIASVRRGGGAGKLERLGQARLERATECFFVGWNCTPTVRRPVALARFPRGSEDDRLRYLHEIAAYDLARCMTDPDAAWEPLDAAFGYVWSCAEVLLLPSGVWVRRKLYDANYAGFLPAVELLEGDALTGFLCTIDRLDLPFLDESPAPAPVPPPAAETASARPQADPETAVRRAIESGATSLKSIVKATGLKANRVRGAEAYKTLQVSKKAGQSPKVIRYCKSHDSMTTDRPDDEETAEAAFCRLVSEALPSTKEKLGRLNPVGTAAIRKWVDEQDSPTASNLDELLKSAPREWCDPADRSKRHSLRPRL